VSAEIERTTGQKVDLVGGGGGIFEIRRDGEVIWKKEDSGHFPKPGEAAELF
jgi:predicted Rdx family selenoprotein|tara:strand:- start:1659 stop:1814 length:156 start_codon:yes stop_codon:yes gene_type:complete